MKKLILFLVFLSTLSSQSQDFWTEYSTSQPINGTGITSISIIDANNTWLNMQYFCLQNPCSNTMRQYSKTTNGGTFWTTGTIDLGSSSSNLFIANISGVSSLVAYASVYPITTEIGGIWKTADGGTTWTRQNAFNDQNSFTDLVHFWNANEGVAMGNAVDGYFEIYTTINGGDTWTRLTSTSSIIPINGSERICVNNFTVTNNTIWVATTAGRILKSTNKGLTWIDMQTPITELWSGALFENPGLDLNNYQMAFTDQNRGLFLYFDLQTSYSARFYQTSDGGATWSEVMYIDSTNSRNADIAAVPGMPNTYIVVGDDIDGIGRGSSYTVDGGLTWIDINQVDIFHVRGSVVAMLDADHGFAAGFSTSPSEGGIYNWGGGALLRQAQLAVSSFSGDHTIAISPNPTSGILNISAKNIKEIVVSDVLGKQIINQTYDALETVNLDLDFLISGIYILRVTNGEGTFVSKVIKK